MRIPKQFTAILTLILLIAAPALPNANETNLSPETSVKLILLEKQKSGDSKRYSRVNYKVDEDVTDTDGNILIRKGTPAYGTVLSSRRNGMLGRRGILDISVEYTTAVDGQKVNLRATKGKHGKSNKGLITAGALLVAWPLVFCKGSNVSIDAGTTFVAYVNDSLKIKHAKTGNKKNTESESEENLQPDKLITLKNGDRMSGRIVGMNDGVYTIKTSGGSLEVPEENIQAIETIAKPETTENKKPLSELEKRLEALKKNKK